MGLFKNKNKNYQRSTQWAQDRYDDIYEQAQDWFDKAQEAYDWTQEQWGAIAPTFEDLSQKLMDLADTTFTAGDEFYQRYWDVTVPMEDELRAKADRYGTAEYKNLRAAEAMRDVDQGIEAARKGALQDLSDFGADPSQAGYGALDAQYRRAAALGKVQAAQNERRYMDEYSDRLKMGLTAQQQNLPGFGTNAASQELAQEAWRAGVLGQAGNMALTPYTAFAGSMGNWQGLQGTGVNQQMAATGGRLNAQQMYNQNLGYGGGGFLGSGFGGLLGTGIGAAMGNPGLGAAIGNWAFGPSTPSGPTVNPTQANWNQFSFEKGGPVPDVGHPPIPGTTDETRAVLTPGEYILPEDVTRWLGEEKIGKMIAKSREDRQAQSQQQAIPM